MNRGYKSPFWAETITPALSEICKIIEWYMHDKMSYMYSKCMKSQYEWNNKIN